jgi:bis(5'-nucleosyl)-tetraphosphatase (symmetrical)
VAVYAIGDVQGCMKTLDRLLARIDYKPRKDRILFTGDLVNRGPRSLEVLRWAIGEKKRVVSVMGNHELHLLRAALGLRAPSRRDTFADVLKAPDREALIGWLRARPLAHAEGQFLLVHAGMWPSWTAADLLAISAEMQASMASSDQLLAAIGDFRLEDAASALTSPARLRAAVVLATTMRMIDKDGEPLRFAGPPEEAPPGSIPWYAVPGRRWGASRVIFGHWAALGSKVMAQAVALDSGCVWGHALTAFRLDDGRVFVEPAADGAATD